VGLNVSLYTAIAIILYNLYRGSSHLKNGVIVFDYALVFVKTIRHRTTETAFREPFTLIGSEIDSLHIEVLVEDVNINQDEYLQINKPVFEF